MSSSTTSAVWSLRSRLKQDPHMWSHNLQLDLCTTSYWQNESKKSRAVAKRCRSSTLCFRHKSQAAFPGLRWSAVHALEGKRRRVRIVKVWLFTLRQFWYGAGSTRKCFNIKLWVWSIKIMCYTPWASSNEVTDCLALPTGTFQFRSWKPPLITMPAEESSDPARKFGYNDEEQFGWYLCFLILRTKSTNSQNFHMQA